MKRTQALLQKQEQLVECLKGEIKAFSLEKDQLRYELFCVTYRTYIDRKQRGDTILALAYPHCIGIAGYTKNWSRE